MPGACYLSISLSLSLSVSLFLCCCAMYDTDRENSLKFVVVDAMRCDAKRGISHRRMPMPHLSINRSTKHHSFVLLFIHGWRLKIQRESFYCMNIPRMTHLETPMTEMSLLVVAIPSSYGVLVRSWIALWCCFCFGWNACHLATSSIFWSQHSSSDHILRAIRYNIQGT